MEVELNTHTKLFFGANERNDILDQQGPVVWFADDSRVARVEIKPAMQHSNFFSDQFAPVFPWDITPEFITGGAKEKMMRREVWELGGPASIIIGESVFHAKTEDNKFTPFQPQGILHELKPNTPLRLLDVIQAENDENAPPLIESDECNLIKQCEINGFDGIIMRKRLQSYALGTRPYRAIGIFRKSLEKLSNPEHHPVRAFDAPEINFWHGADTIHTLQDVLMRKGGDGCKYIYQLSKFDETKFHQIAAANRADALIYLQQDEPVWINERKYQAKLKKFDEISAKTGLDVIAGSLFGEFNPKVIADVRKTIKSPRRQGFELASAI